MSGELNEKGQSIYYGKVGPGPSYGDKLEGRGPSEGPSPFGGIDVFTNPWLLSGGNGPYLEKDISGDIITPSIGFHFYRELNR